MSDRLDGIDQVLGWVRTSDFTQPVQWGVIESEILSKPAPDLDLPMGPRPIFGLRIYLLGALLYAFPALGFIVLVSRWNAVIGDSGSWATAVFVAFLIALAVPFVTFQIWHGCGRRRRLMDPIVTAISGASAAGAFILLQWGGVDLGGSLLVLLILAAAVANLGFLVLWLLGSRPGSPATPRNARPQSREDLNYNNVRAQTIEILVKRGVVNERDIDIPSMLNMPIGSWRKLDA